MFMEELLFAVSLCQTAKEDDMSVFIFKIIALVSMFTDHTGAILFPNEMIFRMIGRAGFVFYCFFTVQGVIHTKNIKKYFKRVVVLAFVSEIPYNLAFGQSVLYPGSLNVLFLFSIFIMTCMILEKYSKKGKDFTYFTILLSGALVFLLNPDGGIGGYAVLWIMYYGCKKNRTHIPPTRHILAATAVIATSEMMVPFLMSGMKLSDYILHGDAYVFTGLLVPAVCMYFYNGKQGKKSKWIDMVFYISYPLHLSILYTISAFL